LALEAVHLVSCTRKAWLVASKAVEEAKLAPYLDAFELEEEPPTGCSKQATTVVGNRFATATGSFGDWPFLPCHYYFSSHHRSSSSHLLDDRPCCSTSS
jgi:hypothetical protein